MGPHRMGSLGSYRRTGRYTITKVSNKVKAGVSPAFFNEVYFLYLPIQTLIYENPPFPRIPDVPSVLW